MCSIPGTFLVGCPIKWELNLFSEFKSFLEKKFWSQSTVYNASTVWPLATFEPSTNKQSIEAFSTAGALPVVTSSCAILTAISEKLAIGCNTVWLISPATIASITSLLPSKPATITSFIPAAFNAAEAPKAIVSFPAITPLIFGWAWINFSIISKASDWLQFADWAATFTMSG